MNGEITMATSVYFTVSEKDSCEEAAKSPVCDTDNREHANSCYLLRAGKSLAYNGPCLVSPRDRGKGIFDATFAGHNNIVLRTCSAGGMQRDRRPGMRRGREHVSVRVRGVCGIDERRLRGTVRNFRLHRPQRTSVLRRSRGQLPHTTPGRVHGHHTAWSMLPEVRRSPADTVQVLFFYKSYNSTFVFAPEILELLRPLI